MKKVISLGLALSLWLLSMTGCGGAISKPVPVDAFVLAEPDTPLKDVAPYDLSSDFREALWRFASKTAGAALENDKEKNALYSPVSLYFSLAMLSEGAKGETKEALENFLELEDPENLASDMQRLYSMMTGEHEYSEERLANAVWFDQGLIDTQGSAIEQSWLDQLSGHYYASVFASDFTDPDTATKMSQWVEDETKGKIRPEIDLADPLLQLVLMNTIYYYAGWATPFSPDKTMTDLFTNSEGKTIKLPFMQGVFSFTSAIVDPRFTAVSLPLSNGSIQLILPEENLEPEDLLIDPDFISDFRSREWESCEAHLSIPKFESQHKIDILKAMEDLGLADIVQNNPDFSAMIHVPDQPTFVGAITQETYIAFNEKGIEAAAYTEIRLPGAGPGVPEVLELAFDRPYIYVISDQAGVPLFIGIVRNPK